MKFFKYLKFDFCQKYKRKLSSDNLNNTIVFQQFCNKIRF